MNRYRPGTPTPQQAAFIAAVAAGVALQQRGGRWYAQSGRLFQKRMIDVCVTWGWVTPIRVQSLALGFAITPLGRRRIGGKSE